MTISADNTGQGSAELVNRTSGGTLGKIGLSCKSGYLFGHRRGDELIEGNVILTGNFTGHIVD